MTKNSKKFRSLNPGSRMLPAIFMAGLLAFAGPAVAQQPNITATAGGAKAASGAIADSPCDVKYYESMKSRAWLEAQREITQNQNLIFKPDSVLQYTCFDQFTGSLGAKSKGMFSDTEPAPPGPSLSQSLQETVGTAVSSYLGANYGHTMLGGRSDIAYKPSNSSSYNCTIMNQVWQQAKCMNFIDKSHDGFFTFAQYATPPDKRMLPGPKGCPGTTLWTQEIPKATGAKTPWVKDPTKTFFKQLTECSGAPAVSTGIYVGLGLSGKKAEEKFCIPAGCTYVHGTGTGGGSCQPVTSASSTTSTGTAPR